MTAIPETRFEQAKAELAKWIATLPGGPRSLANAELRRYSARGIVAGWRLKVTFDSAEVELDLLVNAEWPFSPPRVALVDQSRFLKWPHVEWDGVLCLLPGGAGINITAPVDVAARLLGDSCLLIEDCVSGKNQVDFQSEFLSYWEWSIKAAHQPIYSLLQLEPPSRSVRVWRGQNWYLVGEADSDIQSWLGNRLDKRDAKWSTEPAVLAWFAMPPMPSQYPSTAGEFVQLLETEAPDAATLLDVLAKNHPDKIVGIMAASTANGPCAAAVTLTAPSARRRSNRMGPDPITQGFRPGKVPLAVAKSRYLSTAKLTRLSVNRVDASWIHGRGRDLRLPRLRGAKVVILGCGSLGAAVASRLAQAGVGTLHLVDPQVLVSANVGRHVLGMPVVGQFKALALAQRIRSDYPHILSVEGHASSWEALAGKSPEVLTSCDLIVSAIGDWAAESALNDWHRQLNPRRPLIYGWMEANACAGHAAAILGDDGCLACGFGTDGLPALRVTHWQSNALNFQEAACGAVYQPYGPVEMTHIEALVADLSLDCLLQRIQTSTHRIWAARRDRLEEAGGQWTPEWLKIAGDRLQGGFVEERLWPSKWCVSCRVLHS